MMASPADNDDKPLSESRSSIVTFYVSTVIRLVQSVAMKQLDFKVCGGARAPLPTP